MHAHLSTFLFQAINFLVLVLVLRRWLYRPVLAMIARRQQEAQAPLAAAAAERQAAAQARAEAERLEAEARAARETLLAQAETELRGRREAALVEAHRAADALAARAQGELEHQRAAAEGALRARAAGVAAEIAARLLAAAGCPTATDRLLDQAIDAVEALDPRQRAATPAAGHEVRVLTAAALGADRRAAVTDRLRRALGRDVSVGFGEDAGLIAGAEIHLPTAVVRQSWRDQLADARRSLS
jgi:F-type H+-transporting ATPase subunit b